MWLDTSIKLLASILFLVSIDLLLFLYTTSVFFKDKKKTTIALLNIPIPIGIMVYLGWQFHYLAWLYFILVISTIDFVLMLGRYGDGKFTVKEFAISVITLLIFASFFGKYVYGEMPRVFGGGSSLPAKIIFNEKGNSFAQKINKLQGNPTLGGNTSIIYSTMDIYLLKFDSNIVAIDKSLIDGFVLSPVSTVIDSSHASHAMNDSATVKTR